MDLECSSRAGVAKVWLKLLVPLGGGPLAVWLECAFGEVIFQPFRLPPWPLKGEAPV